MFEYSNIFTNSDQQSRQFKDTILASSNKIYKVEDCDINITTRGVDTKQSVNSLTKFYSKRGLTHVMGHYNDITQQEVPVMTHENYLKELKDTVLETQYINLGNLTRLPMRISDSITVCNVIVTGKYPSENVLINEVFVDDKYVTTYEYRITDLLEACTELIGD